MADSCNLKSEQQLLFDKISLNVLTKLADFDQLSSVNFFAEEGVPESSLIRWGKVNEPYLIPDDLASFYSMFNGFKLRWDVLIGAKHVTVGDMQLNGLNDLKPVTSSHLAAFTLSSHCDVGDLVLVYDSLSSDESISSTVRPTMKTEIWFRDSKAEWHYVCSTFTHLFRLMVTHLGKGLIL